MTDLDKRLHPRIDRSDTDGCWPWTGSTDAYGYGQIKLNGRAGRCEPVHRLVWELLHEVELTSNQVVCHHCDNRLCANPDHLFVARRSDNSADMVLKGRHANQQKTHCPAGHELAGQNLVIVKQAGRNPGRACRTCRRESQRRYKARNAA